MKIREVNIADHLHETMTSCKLLSLTYSRSVCNTIPDAVMLRSLSIIHIGEKNETRRIEGVSLQVCGGFTGDFMFYQ